MKNYFSIDEDFTTSTFTLNLSILFIIWSTAIKIRCIKLDPTLAAFISWYQIAIRKFTCCTKGTSYFWKHDKVNYLCVNNEQ